MKIKVKMMLTSTKTLNKRVFKNFLVVFLSKKQKNKITLCKLNKKYP